MPIFEQKTPSAVDQAAALAQLSISKTRSIQLPISSATQNVPSTLATISTGPGIVTKIWFATLNRLYMQNSHILVYVDGNAVPIDFELGVMPGIAQNPFVLPAGTSVQGSTQNFEWAAGGQGFSWMLKYPIPYSSSCVIKYVNLGFTVTNSLYSVIEYQDGASSVRRLSNNGTMRLFVDAPAWSSATSYLQGAYASISGVNYRASFANTNSQPPNSNWASLGATSATFYSGTQLGNGTVALGRVSSTPLWIVGMGLMATSIDGTWMENTPAIYDVSDSTGNPTVGTFDVGWSGFEDAMGSAYYFTSHQPLLGITNTGGAGTGRNTVVAGASPWTYTNNGPGHQYVVITGGTVSQVQITRDGTNFDTVASASPCTVIVSNRDQLVVTYSATPTVVVYPIPISSQGGSNTLILSQIYSTNATENINSPGNVGLFKDFLAQNGGIKVNNGLIMRFELPPGKTGPSGSSTSIGWNILYYT